ncbi:flagellar filament capping protein FliD, partial [Aquifex sp.]
NIIAVKSIPIQRLSQEKEIITQKLELLGKLSEKIDNLKTLLEGFNLEEALNTKEASVSNPDILSVSLSQDAPEISFSVNVIQTAQKEILVYDAGFSSLDETVGSSGSFTLRYYTDSTNYVEFTIEYSSTDTLRDIINKINEAQDYVKASIYYDGSRYKLMLAETSESNSSVETAPDLSVKAIHLLGTLPPQFGSNVLIQQAKNAQIQIGNGPTISNASNTFENIIGGVSITVKDVGTSQVEITQSFSELSKFLEEFVKAYNDVVNQVKSLTLGENAPFRGENTIMDLKFRLADTINPLIELGIIEVNEDGTIKVSGNLEEAINSNPDGFKLKFNEFLDVAKAIVNFQSENFTQFKELLQEKTERIDERIRFLAERLAKEEELLKKQFAQLEDFIRYANDIKARLQQFIVSITETGGKE